MCMDEVSLGYCSQFTKLNLLHRIYVFRVMENAENTISGEQRDKFDLNKCSDWIKTNNYSKVCLQFPESLLKESVDIAAHLERETGQKVYILADTTFGSCCVDEIACLHVNADAVIHFGHACLSPVQKLPVLYVFPKTKFCLKVFYKRFEKLEVEYPCLILYDVGFYYVYDKLRTYFLQKDEISISELVHEGHLNSCSKVCSRPTEGSHTHVRLQRGFCLPSEHDNFKTVIYLGNKNQVNFQNFLVTMKDCRFYEYSPCNDKFFEVPNVDLMKKISYLVEKVKDAYTIGIVVATLGIKGYREAIEHVKKLCDRKNKESFIISVGKPNPAKLANFPEIDIFVSIACPESDWGDTKSYLKPIIGLFELDLALNEERSWDNAYSRDFRDIIDGGDSYVQVPKETGQDSIEVSLTSKYVQRNTFNTENQTTISKCQDIAKRSDMTVSVKADDAKCWQGLDPRVGQDKPCNLQQGRSGIASERRDNAVKASISSGGTFVGWLEVNPAIKQAATAASLGQPYHEFHFTDHYGKGVEDNFDSESSYFCNKIVHCSQKNQKEATPTKTQEDVNPEESLTDCSSEYECSCSEQLLNVSGPDESSSFCSCEQREDPKKIPSGSSSCSFSSYEKSCQSTDFNMSLPCRTQMVSNKRNLKSPYDTDSFSFYKDKKLKNKRNPRSYDCGKTNIVTNQKRTSYVPQHLRSSCSFPSYEESYQSTDFQICLPCKNKIVSNKKNIKSSYDTHSFPSSRNKKLKNKRNSRKWSYDCVNTSTPSKQKRTSYVPQRLRSSSCSFPSYKESYQIPDFKTCLPCKNQNVSNKRNMKSPYDTDSFSFSRDKKLKNKRNSQKWDYNCGKSNTITKQKLGKSSSFDCHLRTSLKPKKNLDSELNRCRQYEAEKQAELNRAIKELKEAMKCAEAAAQKAVDCKNKKSNYNAAQESQAIEFQRLNRELNKMSALESRKRKEFETAKLDLKQMRDKLESQVKTLSLKEAQKKAEIEMTEQCLMELRRKALKEIAAKANLEAQRQADIDCAMEALNEAKIKAERKSNELSIVLKRKLDAINKTTAKDLIKKQEIERELSEYFRLEAEKREELYQIQQRLRETKRKADMEAQECKESDAKKRMELEQNAKIFRENLKKARVSLKSKKENEEKIRAELDSAREELENVKKIAELEILKLTQCEAQKKEEIESLRRMPYQDRQKQRINEAFKTLMSLINCLDNSSKEFDYFEQNSGNQIKRSESCKAKSPLPKQKKNESFCTKPRKVETDKSITYQSMHNSTNMISKNRDGVVFKKSFSDNAIHNLHKLRTKECKKNGDGEIKSKPVQFPNKSVSDKCCNNSDSEYFNIPGRDNNTDVHHNRMPDRKRVYLKVEKNIKEQPNKKCLPHSPDNKPPKQCKSNSEIKAVLSRVCKNRVEIDNSQQACEPYKLGKENHGKAHRNFEEKDATQNPDKKLIKSDMKISFSKIEDCYEKKNKACSSGPSLNPSKAQNVSETACKNSKYSDPACNIKKHEKSSRSVQSKADNEKCDQKQIVMNPDDLAKLIIALEQYRKMEKSKKHNCSKGTSDNKKPIPAKVEFELPSEPCKKPSSTFEPVIDTEQLNEPADVEIFDPTLANTYQNNNYDDDEERYKYKFLDDDDDDDDDDYSVEDENEEEVQLANEEDDEKKDQNEYIGVPLSEFSLIPPQEILKHINKLSRCKRKDIPAEVDRLLYESYESLQRLECPIKYEKEIEEPEVEDTDVEKPGKYYSRNKYKYEIPTHDTSYLDEDTSANKDRRVEFANEENGSVETRNADKENDEFYKSLLKLQSDNEDELNVSKVGIQSQVSSMAPKVSFGNFKINDGSHNLSSPETNKVVWEGEADPSVSLVLSTTKETSEYDGMGSAPHDSNKRNDAATSGNSKSLMSTDKDSSPTTHTNRTAAQNQSKPQMDSSHPSSLTPLTFETKKNETENETVLSFVDIKPEVIERLINKYEKKASKRKHHSRLHGERKSRGRQD